MADDSIPAVLAGVLRQAGRPLLPKEILQEIQARGLYTLKAKDPLHVVNGQLRRHCINLDFPSARPTKLFRATSDGRFEALPAPQKVSPTLYEVEGAAKAGPVALVSIPVDDPVQGDAGQAAGPTHT